MAASQVLTLLTEKLNSAAMALVLTPFCSLVLTASRVSWDIGAGIATFAAHFRVNNFDVRRMQNLGEAVTDEAAVDEFAKGATRTGNATAQPPNPPTPDLACAKLMGFLGIRGYAFPIHFWVISASTHISYHCTTFLKP